MIRKAFGLVWLVLGLFMAGCGAQPTATQPTAAVVPPTAATVGVTVSDAWARAAVAAPAASATPGMGGNDTTASGGVSAAYFTLLNTGGSADALVKVASDVAASVELHTMTMNAGVMEMRPVAQIDLPVGAEVKLAPGGFHVMLIGLKKDLVEGETVKLTLTLKSGATIEVSAPVKKAA